MSFRLSKSKLTSFQHCARRLWLQVHRREVGVTDPWTKRLFETGHRIGELARLQVPNGILIDPAPRNLVAAFVETGQALQHRRPLFEPAFIRDGVVVRVDILEPEGSDRWRLIEVKNSAAVLPWQIADVACQGWVVAGSGIQLSGLILRRPTKPLRPGMRGWAVPAFVDEDVTARADVHIGRQEKLVQSARYALEGVEPEISAGPHCTRPFRCEFIAYCSQRPACPRRAMSRTG
jgi:hypothetical protein